jgi:hypothetical protein
MYGAKVWQIPNSEINNFFLLQKWMCYGGQQENQEWKNKE